MMRKAGIPKLLYFYPFIISVTLCIGHSHAIPETWTQPINGLRLSLHSPTQNYKDPNAFQLSVLFENVGKEKIIIILPQSIRQNYEAKGRGTAKYIPFPGPRISPWKDAFTLLPGRRDEIKLVGMRDGDGIWKLEPGTYDFSARYIVPQDFVAAYIRDFPDSKARLWTGSIETTKWTIEFHP
jgi:hypothetical protein